MAELLQLGGLATSEADAWIALQRGQVKIERWTLGLADSPLPRWVLRGVEISRGERSMCVSDDGHRIIRRQAGTLV